MTPNPDTDTPPERDPSADLRPSDRLVLRVVREYEGEISQRDLVADSGLPPSTVSRAVERLADHGYVTSRPVYDDGRCRVICISQ
jgi:uncharacterized membrane protein